MYTVEFVYDGCEYENCLCDIPSLKQFVDMLESSENVDAFYVFESRMPIPQKYFGFKGYIKWKIEDKPLWIYSVPETDIDKCFVSFMYYNTPTISIARFENGKFYLENTQLVITSVYAYMLYPDVANTLV